MITSVIHSQTLQLSDPVIDDTLTGTSGDDVISGGNSNDLIQGKAGDDVLSGGGGDDSLFGGSGDDTIYGGSGDDTLYGGSGGNSLNGGSGDDLVYATYLPNAKLDILPETLDGGSGDDTVSFAMLHKGVEINFGGGDLPNITHFENVIGTDFDDHITRDQNFGFVDGGAGDDYLQSDNNYVSIHLIGGEGDDTLLGTLRGDLLEGDEGKDKIIGLRGPDTIDGGDGRDRISASADGSVITSGQGADVISLMAAKHHDPAAASLITDLENTDRLDLHRIDADSTTGGDQAFTLVESLSGHAGEAALSYDAGSDQTSLLLDTDGDGAANITVLMTGDHTDFTNFVL